MDKPLPPAPSARDGLPNLCEVHFEVPTSGQLQVAQPFTHAPRFLILYGSLRERSFSRFLAYEAARLLEAIRSRNSAADGVRYISGVNCCLRRGSVRESNLTGR